MLRKGLKLNVNELRDQFAESCKKLEVLVNSENCSIPAAPRNEKQGILFA